MTEVPALDPTRCPLCGEPNACAMAADAPGACWCFTTPMADGVLERIPADQRGRACICARCAAGEDTIPEGPSVDAS